MNRRFSEASAEVLEILEHTEKEKIDLIPVNFINYLKENAAQDYVVNIDYSKPISEMNLRVETKGILGTICRNWWWNTEQKQEYRRIVREKEIKNQSELNQKYNVDEIFERRKKETDAIIERIKDTKETSNNQKKSGGIFTRLVAGTKK